MKVRLLIAVLLATLLLAPAHAHRAPDWDRDPALQELETAHASSERMHERWLPELQLEWQRQRERVVDLFCELGVIALALVECNWATAALGPAPVQLLAPIASGSDSDGAHSRPDSEELRRRPLSERMQSI